MRIRKASAAAALSVAMGATFLAGSGGTASAAVRPAAYTDCRVDWVCFWDYPGFAGGAWSVAYPKTAYYPLPQDMAKVVSSVYNNTAHKVTLYSNTGCTPLDIDPYSWKADLSLVTCGGTVYDTWNNRVEGVDVH